MTIENESHLVILKYGEPNTGEMQKSSVMLRTIICIEMD